MGDADSSTFKTLLNGLSWGTRIQKFDCINHTTKNLTNFIERWKKDYKL